MKVVILAGGYGTRLGELTHEIPKPMVEIGNMPIIWHIMKHYSTYGFNEFVICLGYKGYIIKEWFANYFLHNSNVTININTNEIEVHNTMSENWKVTLVDTGLDTLTGSRIKKIQNYIGNEPFLLTYGDGVSDLDLNDLIQSHQNGGKLLTVTAYQPEGRFGTLKIDENNEVLSFAEKVDNQNMWINAGFFVCEPGVFDYIPVGRTDVIFEKEPLENIALDQQMLAYKHNGFWKAMDKLRDKQELDAMWKTNNALWKVWD